MAKKSTPIRINRYLITDAEYVGSCNSSCFFASVSHNQSNIRSVCLVPKPEGTADMKSSGDILAAMESQVHHKFQLEDMLGDMRSMQARIDHQARTRLIRTKSV